MTKHIRICKDCGDKKRVDRSGVKSSRCMSCLIKFRKETNFYSRKKSTPKVRYWYFCPECSSVRAVQIKRASSYCRNCSRYYSKNPKRYYSFDFKIMGFKIRIDTNNKMPKIEKTYKPRKRTHSKEAIAKARDENRAYREEMEAKAKREAKASQKLTDDEMIKNFLKKNEVGNNERTN